MADEKRPRALTERQLPKVGEEGGLDWVVAGELGALMGIGDRALMITLRAFAAYLGYPLDEAEMHVKLWLPGYREHLRARGVANA